MGKQSKSRKPESFGKGKVTPVQIAFIVDRYLSDNNYTQTRSIFRSEASELISKSLVQEAPKSLLSLGTMLDEYIRLKEHKVLLDQEKCRLEHEKLRVQNLLRGMQDVMNGYNGSGTKTNTTTPPMVASTLAKPTALVSHIDVNTGSPAGYPMYNTPVVMSTARPCNTRTDLTNFSTPFTNQTTKRRKDSKEVTDVLVTTKRSRRNKSANQLQTEGSGILPQPGNAANDQENSLQFSAQSSRHDNVTNGSAIQGSTVAKCLFDQPIQTLTNSSGPKTPLRATSSQCDKSVSPLEISSTTTSSKDVTTQQVTSTNCTVISSETFRVSPVKQMAYYTIERNHRISISSPVKGNLKRLSNRDHIKGRLDFESSDMPINSEKSTPDRISASESDKETEIFDFDLPNFDVFGVDFSLSELLVDFDFDGDTIDHFCQPNIHSSPESLSGSPHTSGNDNMGTNQVISELSSNFVSEKDMKIAVPDSITSMKSTTKCIQISSPVKNSSSSLAQENLCPRN